MSEELKPCPVPWCDGKGYEESYGGGVEIETYIIACTKCDVATDVFGAAAEATKAWNTRPLEQKLEQENARLREEKNGLVLILNKALGSFCSAQTIVSNFIDELKEFVAKHQKMEDK